MNAPLVMLRNPTPGNVTYLAPLAAEAGRSTVGDLLALMGVAATDVQQAPDPSWHYVIVSLRQDAPVLRSYRIADGEIGEEVVSLTDR